MAYRTAQERIDDLTMKIENPNVTGSGYIEHPPQVPFAGRVIMQPTTVKADDVPEWFDGQGRGGPYQSHRGGGRGQGGPGQRQYGTGRGYQPQQRSAAHGGVPGYHQGPPPHQHAPRPHYGNGHAAPRPAAPGHPRPPHHPHPHPGQAPPRPGYGAPPAPRPAGGYAPVPQRPPTTPGVFDTSTLMNVLQTNAAPVQHVQQQQQQQQQRRPPAPAVQQQRAPPPAPVQVPEPEEDKKLSKSQRAKLRKKMREGKA